MERFYQFQTYLFDLSLIVSALPQDGCLLMDELQGNASTASPDLTSDSPAQKPVSFPSFGLHCSLLFKKSSTQQRMLIYMYVKVSRIVFEIDFVYCYMCV